MQEWNDEFNAFNTWKVLFHIEKLRQIARGEFPPPVTVDTDLSNACNQNCFYCNSKAFRAQSGPTSQSREHLRQLVKMYFEWGIQSCCIGGGGEPTLNPALTEFIVNLTDHDIETGVISNAVVMSDELKETIVGRCRFFGVSFDSSDPRAYTESRGADHLSRVNKNVAAVASLKAKSRSELDFCGKVLIHERNFETLLATAKHCKELGFNAVHLRPVAIDNIQGLATIGRFDLSKHIDRINTQILKAFELEDENFRVFAVMHKFAEDMGRKISFKKCRGTPIQATFGADGWVYNCFNVRGYEEARIARHEPDPWNIMREWGGERHKWVIENIDPENRCIRCTYNRYNELIEKGILEDKMFYKFP